MFNSINYYNGKTILITGAAGFIGSAVIQALSNVDCNLICLISGSRIIELTAPAQKARLIIQKQDIRGAFLWDALLEKQIDIIFHFAAQTSSRFANENPLEDLEINLIPVVRLIEACQNKAVRPDIIFSGTVTQTGLTKDYPVNENRRDMPITIYDINKLAQEKYLQYYGLEMGGRAVTLRLANVYGPGSGSSRADRGILNMMVINALAGKPLTVYGEGNYVRDYVFIDDVVAAFLKAGAHVQDLNGNYYIIGSGKGHTIKEMAETVKDLVAKIADKQIQIKHVPIPNDLSKIEFRHFVSDIHNFRTTIGWEPKVSLKEGVRRTIQYFMEG